ncbi:serine/threonine protein kinase, partial [Streptomyces albidoflavus]
PGPGVPSTGPPPSTEQGQDPQAASDAIPAQFLGSWDRTDNGVTYRLTIRQGGPGDTVLSMTADGSLGSGATYRCLFEGSLVSADGDSVDIGRTGVVSGPGAPTCTPGAASTLTVLPSGQLNRVMTTGKVSVYDQAG